MYIGASVANLKKRAEILSQLRQFFDERGFTEVQTPVLCRDSIIDRHLDPIEVDMQLPGDVTATWYLRRFINNSVKIKSFLKEIDSFCKLNYFLSMLIIINLHGWIIGAFQ